MSEQSVLCEQKHKYIDEKLGEHDMHFTRLDGEVDALKTTSIRTDVVVQQLCKKIDMMMTIFLTAFMAAVGFIIWYIQSLPR